MLLHHNLKSLSGELLNCIAPFLFDSEFVSYAGEDVSSRFSFKFLGILESLATSLSFCYSTFNFFIFSLSFRHFFIKKKH
jgi:hypothetical protein